MSLGPELTAPVEDLESLLAGGVRALVVDGDLVASRQWFEEAYLMAERAGDTRAIAAAVLGLGGLWVHEHRTAAAATLIEARLRHALSVVDPRSSLALRLRVRLAGETDYRAGDHAAILAVLEEARQAADATAWMQALSLAHHCLLGPEHGALRHRLAVELIGQSVRMGHRSDLLMGLLWQTVDLVLDGEAHAQRRLAELRELLARDGHLAVGFVVSAIEVMLAIRAGRFEQAETLAYDCAGQGATAGDVDATGWCGGQLVAIRWYQGRLTELLPMLTELVYSPTLSAIDNSYFAALAVAAATAGDRRTAAGALATLCGTDLADLPRSSSWLVTMNGIVEAAYLLDDADTATRAYELLVPFAHLPMVASLGVTCFGSAHHALGVASLTIGNIDKAVQHMHAAIQANLALAHWPAVMTSRWRFAQALALRAQPSDAAAARRERATATTEATALGIAPPRGDGRALPEPTVACTRQGRQWRIEWGSRSTLVEHCIGMLHLAVLIANPGVEIHAADLVAGVGALGDTADGPNVTTQQTLDQPMLDYPAIQEYRRRLSQLREEMDDPQSRHHAERAARARAERDWLMAELTGATGLGGRPRRFPDTGERARIAVGKAIRRALTHIAEADAVIGENVRSTVQTGLRCSYRPA
ncbi:MAG: hypothetical protein ACRDQ5_05170 [Sciscionella sp.]